MSKKKSDSEYLKQIAQNTKSNPYAFNSGDQFVMTMVGAVTFIIAIAISDAVQKSFSRIDFGGEKDTATGAWLAALILVMVGLMLVVLLYKIKPTLSNFAGRFNFLHSK